jgi:hypothetical protein
MPADIVLRINRIVFDMTHDNREALEQFALDEACAMATEAQVLRIESMAENGGAVLEPACPDIAMADPENGGGVAIGGGGDDRAKVVKVRVNITVPEDALREIDRYAEAHGFTRSGFLTLAAKRVMAAA